MTDRTSTDEEKVVVIDSVQIYKEKGVEAFLAAEAAGKVQEAKVTLEGLRDTNQMDVMVDHPFDDTRHTDLVSLLISITVDFINILEKGSAPSLFKLSYMTNLLSYAQAIVDGRKPETNASVEFSHGYTIGILTASLGTKAAAEIDAWRDPDVVDKEAAADAKAASILTGDETANENSPWAGAGVAAKETVH